MVYLPETELGSEPMTKNIKVETELFNYHFPSQSPCSSSPERQQKFESRIGSDKCLPYCFPKCVAHRTSSTR